MKRSIIIKAFLEKHTHADLAALYTPGMEVQVNVAADNGERVSKQYKGRDYHEWTDGVQSWKSFRMPYKAWDDPEDNDIELSYDLELHAEAIGMTGWDYANKRSRWVAYDFDAIVGHSDKHTKKLTPQKLQEVQDSVMAIDWVTLRKSTSGNGLHLYVFLDFPSVEINNHNEHMALGRAILSQLSSIANFDLESHVDANSGNMWVWHRKMIGTDGLTLVKQGTSLTNVPLNWQDNLDIVKGKRRRTVPIFITPDNVDDFELLTSQRPKIPLDNGHRELLNWIEKNAQGGSWWKDDQWMLVTHTSVLKRAHEALGLRGLYDTLSQGTEYGADHNCYCFPLAESGWIVRRFTKGTAEHPAWFQDSVGWTAIYYNRYPDLKTVAKMFGGVEQKTGGFYFESTERARPAIEMLGEKINDLTPKALTRSCVLSLHRDKRLVIEIEKVPSDSLQDFSGFDGTKTKWWARILNTQNTENVDNLRLDAVLRHVVDESGENDGWLVYSNGSWNNEPLEHIKLILKGEFGYKPIEVDSILGSTAYSPYIIVNRPFDVEYPPGRMWNRKGARLRYEPSTNLDTLNFPTWSMMLDHLGQSITPFLSDNIWASNNNVVTGADYLTLWVAALFQKPYERSPYLFFYSEEEKTGKSTFHMALSLLIEGKPPRGYMKVNEALKANQTFNAELQDSLICVVEELDLNPRRTDAQVTHNRIKELVTAKYIGMHEKKKTPKMIMNTTHWIQCSNNRLACPIFGGDTRIVMIRVEPIDPLDLIPEPQFLERLEAEAPDFLAHILHMEIPPTNDRLIIPVIESEEKRMVQVGNMSPIELFLTEECVYAPGHKVLWKTLYEQFLLWLDPKDHAEWTQIRTGKKLPARFPKGRSRENAQFYIGNVVLDRDVKVDPDAAPYRLNGDFLDV